MKSGTPTHMKPAGAMKSTHPSMGHAENAVVNVADNAVKGAMKEAHAFGKMNDKGVDNKPC